MTLVARDLRHEFRRGRPVLDAIGLEIHPGALTVLVGPNGSGKTTLLRILAGLIGPSTGAAELDGRAIASIGARERAGRMAFVPQRPEAGFGYSVRQVVGFGRYAAGGSADDTVVGGALDAVGLGDRAGEPFIELSVGQQQRAVLARAIAQLDGAVDGKSLLADEPCSAMDPRHALDSLALIRGLVSRGLTALVAIHDVTLARRVADRAVVLGSDGRLAADGPADEVLRPVVLEGVFGVGFVEAMAEGATVLAPVGPTHPPVCPAVSGLSRINRT